MVRGEKVKETSTTISYHEEKRSEKFTASGSENYCVSKWENMQYKVK